MIDNGQDILDSRDIHKRVEELEAGLSEAKDAEPNFAEEDWEEYQTLKQLDEEGSQLSSDWQYGAALIRDSYFEDYAQQVAEDIGAIDNNTHWPATCIDWEQAAREMQVDYSSLEYDGVTYWVRS